MARDPVWTSIAAALTAEIAGGQYRPGDKLPAEAALAARFGVNRHTVRRAIATLSEAGLTHARRGAGVFVTARPTDYPLGRRVRFHQNLAAAGQSAARQVLRSEIRSANTREAEALGLVAAGAPVAVFETLSLADGTPLALSRSVFPADRFPEILDHLGCMHSVTGALRQSGVPDYTRASTRLTAKRATAVQAGLLRIAEGAPILRSVSINIDPAGQPVEYGHSWFAGDRVTLTVTPEG